jgi:hypothetical protein
MNNNELSKFVQAVGAVAESSALLYKELVKNGVPPDQAAIITQGYIKAIIAMDRGNKDDG